MFTKLIRYPLFKVCLSIGQIAYIANLLGYEESFIEDYQSEYPFFSETAFEPTVEYSANFDSEFDAHLVASQEQYYYPSQNYSYSDDNEKTYSTHDQIPSFGLSNYSPLNSADLNYYEPGVPAVPENNWMYHNEASSSHLPELNSSSHEIQNFVSFPQFNPSTNEPTIHQTTIQTSNQPQSYSFENEAAYSLIPSHQEKIRPLTYVTTETSNEQSLKDTQKLSQTLANETPQRFQILTPASQPEFMDLTKEIAQLTDLTIPLKPELIESKTSNTLPVPSKTAASSQTPVIIAPDNTLNTKSEAQPISVADQSPKEISVNFNNVAMIEYVRFVSRLSNKNFMFNDEDLQFNVTIVSEEPITVENFMSALLQELKIRDLSLIELGNNIIIHRNPRIRAPGRIISDENQLTSNSNIELVTRVFRLNTLDPLKASEIIRPLLSEDALVEILRDSNKLIITDLVVNINKITQLINSVDSPNNGMMIGQYVVKNAFVDSLVQLATQIIQPIAQGNPFTLIPHASNNSIYIVSNSFIVEKVLAILQNLDDNERRTKIVSLDNLFPLNVAGYNKPKTNEVQETRRLYIVPDGYQVDEEGYLIDANGKRVLKGAANTDGFVTDPQGFVKSAIELLSIPQKIRQGQDILFGPPGYQVDKEGYLLTSQGNQAIPGTPGLENYEIINGKVRARSGKAFVPAAIFSSPNPTPLSDPNTGIVPGRLSTQSQPFNVETFPSGQIQSPPNPAFQVNTFPSGQIQSQGSSAVLFDGSRDFLPGSIESSSRWSQTLPRGHIERTIFSIYKLRYRRGDQIEIALRKVAISLQQTGTANVDLLSAINSVQWIEASNSLILTGTAEALERIRDLIQEIDTPLRQVFIEMLVLATTIEDSLQYGVQINQSSKGNSFAETQSFTGNIASSLAAAIDYTTNPPMIGNLGAIMNGLGYTANIIGTHITHGGTQFNSISALVRALHQNTKTRILLNPKIIAEDNTTATLFVGTTDRYKTQSITNDLGSLVTNNFEFIDVGTTLKVTPLIGNNGVITLDISQETSNGDNTANTTAGGSNNTATTDVNLVPVISTSRTNTRVHIPNGFFIILSGMIQDVESRVQNRIPCLGGIPILGALCKQKGNEDRKQNLMIFIRPLIVDTEAELEALTRRQQDIFREKSKLRREMNYEIDEALDQLNLKPTDPDALDCEQY